MISKFTDLIKKFDVIGKNSIPSSLKAEYENIQISNNIFRFKLTCIILFVINIFLFILDHNLNNNTVINEQYISIIYMVTSIIFYVLFNNIDKIAKSIKQKWFLCYSFAYIICLIQFLYIINVTIKQQPSFPFIILINLLVVVPDFKPIRNIILIITIFLGALFIQFFYLPITTLAVIKVINISTFTLICIMTNIFLYSKNVRVYLDEVKLKEMNEHLALISTIDELTTLPNRRAFNYFYDNIWIHCKRLNLPLCVIMIDIDYFKKYNDILGHIEGDKALQAVSNCLKSCIKRDTDFVARYGGEEFVGIIPYLEQEEVYPIIENIQKSVEQLKIRHPQGVNSYLSVSVGAAFVRVNTCEPDLCKEKLLDCADKVLYEAKNNGRNKIVFHNLNNSTS